MEKAKILDLITIELMESKLSPYWWPDNMYPTNSFSDAFKHLILTVLSQNTSEANSIKAYRSLSSKFKIKPTLLADASLKDLREGIKIGGLYNIKAMRIKKLSKEILDKFDGRLDQVLALPKEKAKKILKGLPGVGNKTADVLLIRIHSYKKVIPIDTHYMRIAECLGLVNPGASYDEIQKAIISFIPKENRERTAGLLWLLAKHQCKVVRPKCGCCPLKKMCKYRSTQN